jgi:hypothetical protein
MTLTLQVIATWGYHSIGMIEKQQLIGVFDQSVVENPYFLRGTFQQDRFVISLSGYIATTNRRMEPRCF